MTLVKRVLLWSSLVLSTVLSAGFFFSLGDGFISGFFLAVLGVIFEGLKAYSWHRVGTRAVWYLLLGVPCTILSLASSIGFASLTLERGWSAADNRVALQLSADREAQSLGMEESALIDSLEKLPSGWTTSALRLSERIQAVRAQKHSVTQVPVAPTETSTASLAVSLGNRFGIEGTLVVTILLMAIATFLEVGIIILVLDKDKPRISKLQSAQDGAVHRFLREAVGPDGKLLGRRRLVELGWSEKEVREHVTTLIQTGVLTHQGRGSPIRLAE